MQSEHSLWQLYHRLWEAFGPQGWWPGETPFEVAVGAILTQNTNWTNVARALEGLKQEGKLTAEALAVMPEEELARWLRPTGYFNVKARRVKNFLAYLMESYGGSMEQMAEAELAVLRPELLAIKGIGPETADSILLYALNKPTFVVDAYTFRILRRHELVPESCTYDELQQEFMRLLPEEVELYQEFHALLVRLGKEFCRPRPGCDPCPAAGVNRRP